MDYEEEKKLNNLEIKFKRFKKKNINNLDINFKRLKKMILNYLQINSIICFHKK